MGLETQIKGGTVQGFGLAVLEHIVFDPQNGLPANVGLYQAKPPTYLEFFSAPPFVSGVTGPEDSELPIGFSATPTPIPEPAWELLLAGLGMLSLVTRWPTVSAPSECQSRRRA